MPPATWVMQILVPRHVGVSADMYPPVVIGYLHDHLISTLPKGGDDHGGISDSLSTLPRCDVGDAGVSSGRGEAKPEAPSEMAAPLFP